MIFIIVLIITLTIYSKQVDDLLDKGIGKVYMLKRFFYKMFKTAWDASFIE